MFPSIKTKRKREATADESKKGSKSGGKTSQQNDAYGMCESGMVIGMRKRVGKPSWHTHRDKDLITGLPWPKNKASMPHKGDLNTATSLVLVYLASCDSSIHLSANFSTFTDIPTASLVQVQWRWAWNRVRSAVNHSSDISLLSTALQNSCAEINNLLVIKGFISCSVCQHNLIYNDCSTLGWLLCMSLTKYP